MAQFIKPMLGFLGDKPFDSPEWLFEVKWDGYRAIAEVEGAKVKLLSRNFKSMNARFPPIVNALKELGVEAIFDGEIVILDERGVSHFQTLQNYQKSGLGDLRYCIFDLLYLHGKDLRPLPLIERKKILKSLLPASSTSILLYSDHILAKGKEFFRAIQKQNLEGLMGKQIQSPYESGRSRAWVKIKTHASQEAVICGFTAPRGGRQLFGALILGVYDQRVLKYIGRVGTGFDRSLLSEVMQKLKPLITKTCPFTVPPPTNANASVTWVKPKLVCEVSFAEWTNEGSLRQPIFVGLRTDKDPKSIQKEVAIPMVETAGDAMEESTEETKAQAQPKHKHAIPANVPLTHLDKVFWPKEGYTKGDLIDYYREMTPCILAYLKDRPEILHRFPNGIESEGFYQKKIDRNFPAWVTTVKIQHEHREVQYFVIDDPSSLLFAINLGCIDLNPFNSSLQSLQKPDYMVIDLDPEHTSFADVIESAQVVHALLASLGIQSYCKTSGGRGLHIYVPLGAKYSYEQVRLFAQLIAQMAHERLPKITSMERSPKKRQKKVYFDYLQNNFGQSLAAPYSVRPRPGALVSTPLDWSEVKPGLDPSDFNIKTVPKRVKQKGDLFLPVLGKGIDLQRALKQL